MSSTGIGLQHAPATAPLLAFCAPGDSCHLMHGQCPCRVLLMSHVPLRERWNRATTWLAGRWSLTCVGSTLSLTLPACMVLGEIFHPPLAHSVWNLLLWLKGIVCFRGAAWYVFWSHKFYVAIAGLAVWRALHSLLQVEHSRKEREWRDATVTAQLCKGFAASFPRQAAGSEQALLAQRLAQEAEERAKLLTEKPPTWRETVFDGICSLLMIITVFTLVYTVLICWLIYPDNPRHVGLSGMLWRGPHVASWRCASILSARQVDLYRVHGLGPDASYPVVSNPYAVCKRFGVDVPYLKRILLAQDDRPEKRYSFDEPYVTIEKPACPQAPAKALQEHGLGKGCVPDPDHSPDLESLDELPEGLDEASDDYMGAAIPLPPVKRTWDSGGSSSSSSTQAGARANNTHTSNEDYEEVSSMPTSFQAQAITPPSLHSG